MDSFLWDLLLEGFLLGICLNDMDDAFQIDHGIWLELPNEVTCYLRIYYAEDYCESISVNQAKQMIEFLNRYVEANEEK